MAGGRVALPSRFIFAMKFERPGMRKSFMPSRVRAQGGMFGLHISAGRTAGSLCSAFTGCDPDWLPVRSPHAGGLDSCVTAAQLWPDLTAFPAAPDMKKNTNDVT